MTSVRKASQVYGTATFPYNSKHVCFFEIYSDGLISQLHYKDEKRKAYENAKIGKSKIYAVWPGEWTSDLFEIDDLEAYINNI